MEWYQILTFIVSLLSLPTIAGLIWKDIYDRKKNDNIHVGELKNKENEKILRSVIKDEIKVVEAKVDNLDKKVDKIGAGALSGLRNDILTCYYKCREKGYRNDYDYQNIHDLYDAYEGLHGNSFVKDIMIRFDRLPTKEQYRSKNKTQGGIDNGEE